MIFNFIITEYVVKTNYFHCFLRLKHLKSVWYFRSDQYLLSVWQGVLSQFMSFHLIPLPACMVSESVKLCD